MNQYIPTPQPNNYIDPASYRHKVIIHNTTQLAAWFAANHHQSMLHCIRFGIDQCFSRKEIKEALDIYMFNNYQELSMEN
jgi:hypothetical protein